MILAARGIALSAFVAAASAAIAQESGVSFGSNGDLITTPGIAYGEPGELSSSKAKWGEKFASKKWRKKYNKHELTVLLWQVYRLIKEGADWKDIFSLQEELLTDEIAMHSEYYDGMLAASAIVSGSRSALAIVEEFGLIRDYAREIADLLSDPDVWPDVERRDAVAEVVDEIVARAVRTARYIPLIAGVEVPGLSGDPDAADAPVEGKFWSSPYDRVVHVERMRDELTDLRRDVGELYALVSARSRTTATADHLDLLFARP